MVHILQTMAEVTQRDSLAETGSVGIAHRKQDGNRGARRRERSRSAASCFRRAAWVWTGLSIAIVAYMAGHLGSVASLPPNRVLDEAIRQLYAQLGRAAFLEPRVYEWDGVRRDEAGDVRPGLTLVASVWKAGGRPQPGLRLLDATGAVVHRWTVDPSRIVPDSAGSTAHMNEPDIQGMYLFPNGDVLVNIQYVATARLDACGRPIWVLAQGNHHSIARADDGTFWIPGSSGRVEPAAPGFPADYPWLTRPVYLDRLLHVTEDGEVIEKKDVLDILHANGLDRYIYKAGDKPSWEITHLNDVEPLSRHIAGAFPLFTPGDLLVSLRNLDLVLVVDPVGWRVKWHASEPFHMQHDPDFLPDGWIGVFDNNRDETDRGTALGGSRVVAIEPRTHSTRILFPGPRSRPFYTEIRGNWQQLADGGLLLVESSAGRVQEVAPDGRTVWEWVVPAWDEKWGPSVGEAERVDLNPGDVEDWPCSESSLAGRGGEGR